MHRGPADGVLAVRGGRESAVGTVATGFDRTGPGTGEYGLSPLAGGWFGELGEIALAVVLLALFGLALVVLSQSEFASPTRNESSSPDRESAATTEPGTEPVAGTETGGITGEEIGPTVTRERTDAEVVIDMLVENGGRMHQGAIVEDTDWSKSKVSMILSEMEEKGEISKLRVGRENIVSLQGNEPEAANSPFDEE